MVAITLGCSKLSKGIFDEDDNVLLGQAWNNVFINAQFLQTMKLKEIGQP